MSTIALLHRADDAEHRRAFIGCWTPYFVVHLIHVPPDPHLDRVSVCHRRFGLRVGQDSGALQQRYQPGPPSTWSSVNPVLRQPSPPSTLSSINPVLHQPCPPSTRRSSINPVLRQPGPPSTRSSTDVSTFTSSGVLSRSAAQSESANWYVHIIVCSSSL